jgi:hypothetical protein
MLSYTEISKPSISGFLKDDIFGLDIPVYYSFLMDILEPNYYAGEDKLYLR